MLFLLSLALVTQILAAVCKTSLNEMLDWLPHAYKDQHAGSNFINS